MSNGRYVTAVLPGAFDPVTHGHVDLIQRASRFFDRLVVAVGVNPEKTEMFTTAERVEMLRELVGDIGNVEVDSYDDLTAEFVRRAGADVIIRGIRDNVDLRGELRSANTNLIVGDVETFFLLTKHQHVLTSSTLIKQIIEIGGYDPERLGRLVPENVIQRLASKQRQPSR
jgi:pantetheine-phosphate adenylyltransferase